MPEWKPIPLSASYALDREFARWLGTRFMEGAQVPGMGVDCIRFASAVWDRCRGRTEYTKIQNHARGADRHDQATGFETNYKILEALSPVETVRDNTLEPGDLIMTTPGPHVYLAGTRKGTAWVATHQGVTCVGIFSVLGSNVLRIYRPTDKETWL